MRPKFLLNLNGGSILPKRLYVRRAEELLASIHGAEGALARSEDCYQPAMLVCALNRELATDYGEDWDRDIQFLDREVIRDLVSEALSVLREILSNGNLPTPDSKKHLEQMISNTEERLDYLKLIASNTERSWESRERLLSFEKGRLKEAKAGFYELQSR